MCRGVGSIHPQDAAHRAAPGLSIGTNDSVRAYPLAGGPLAGTPSTTGLSPTAARDRALIFDFSTCCPSRASRGLGLWHLRCISEGDAHACNDAEGW